MNDAMNDATVKLLLMLICCLLLAVLALLVVYVVSTQRRLRTLGRQGYGRPADAVERALGGW